MIAMQYRIALPADYPMDRIEHRIRANGHRIDGYPGLLFKAFCYARVDAADYPAPANSYAPFYVWRNSAAMAEFLQGDGFAGLCRDFGRPRVDSWLLTGDPVFPAADTALAAIAETPLASERQTADISGFAPHDWQQVQLRWLDTAPPATRPGESIYRVGYLAMGQREG